jgi:Aspartate/ornithine carbamoyltransferase, Asp/Orn binding domain
VCEQTVFRSAVPVAAVAFLLSCLLPEIKLRKRWLLPIPAKRSACRTTALRCKSSDGPSEFWPETKTRWPSTAASSQPTREIPARPPAFHDQNTAVGREIMPHTATSDGLEVTDEVFAPPASMAFEQAENRLHTINAILVATIGS